MRYSFVALLLLPLLVLGEATPSRSPYDARIRTIAYNAQDVVRINTWYGISTHIHFAENETIQAIAIGDEQAWLIVPRKNHLFVKPKEPQASTNVTVLTDKRIYQLALVLQNPEKGKNTPANPMYSVSFTYPEDQAKAQQKAFREQQLAKHLKRMDEPAAKNTDYWVMGSDAVTPEAAFDDFRFIYLVFGPGTDMPAVYELNDNGDESLINTHVAGNTIVVHRRTKKLMLRKGMEVALIENRSFDRQQTIGNPTGTTSPDVYRTIKEERP